MIYRSGLASFTTENRYLNDWSSSDLLLTLLKISNKPLSRQNTSLRKRMKISIKKCDNNSLGTLNTMFPALSHARLTLYSTSDEQGWQKTNNFAVAGRIPSQWQTNWQKLVFWCSPLICDWYFCRLYVTQFDVLLYFEYENKIWWN